MERPPQTPSRRRFLRTTGIALGGGGTMLGATAGAADAAASGTMSQARQAGFSALAETMAGLRTAGDPGAAGRRLKEWYLAADAAGRAEIDTALDAVLGLPGDFSALGARDRLALLAEQLTGPQESRITTAIGIAVAGLSDARTGLGNVAMSGRLYARTIRALPAQSAGRQETDSPSGAGVAPCPIPKG
ncbi:hypothetical protein GCM10022419_108120 [Nonomuraea rosea]|uniref:Twin-arginine translocation signal domain-containing protein n=1 Tax=Nonomuraea rosea TaxID=638574 RepID=A0ABP6ZCY8_9ACTN